MSEKLNLKKFCKFLAAGT